MDPETMAEGVKKRFACETPPIDEKLLSEFKEFTGRWLKKNMIPLEASSDCTIEKWMESTKYPLWRKKQLLDAWIKCDKIF